MKETPSVLVIDDEVNFHQPLSEALAQEVESKHYSLNFAQSGLQGLKQARKIIDREDTILIIDMILPDIPGERVIEILDEEKTAQSKFKAILISAHKTIEELRELKDKYDWILDYLPKPVDSIYLKNLINNLCGQPLTKFDYGQLDEETANFIRQRTGEINLWFKQTALGAIETGEKIIQIKEKLTPDLFSNWCKSELECHYNTVLTLMRAAKVFGQEKEKVIRSGLGPSIIYLLAQGNVDPVLREEVLELGKSGKSFSYKQVKTLNKEYNQRKQQEIDTGTQAPQPRLLLTTTDKSTIPPSPKKPNQNSPKQEILKVVQKTEVQKTQKQKIEKNSFRQFRNDHFLFHGYPHNKEFIAKLPPQVALALAFPRSSSWQKKAILPVTTNSTFIFQSNFPDCDPDTLGKMIHHALEVYTEEGDSVVVSFLPNCELNILELVDSLGCRCFLAEPDPKKCQKVFSCFSGE